MVVGFTPAHQVCHVPAYTLPPVSRCCTAQIFLGTLREIELERVKEKLSSAIMETCLALTIFREEFNIGFVGMFTVLTFVKVSGRFVSLQPPCRDAAECVCRV